MFDINSLKSGMIVFDKSGNKYVVIRGTPDGDLLFNRKLGTRLNIGAYNENMTHKYFSKYNIVEVCVCQCVDGFFDRNANIKTVWAKQSKLSIEDRIKTLFKSDEIHFTKKIGLPTVYTINKRKVAIIPQEMLPNIIEFLYGDIETFLKHHSEGD